MIVKLVKIFGIAFSIFAVVLTLLYIFGPYLIKNRFQASEAKSLASAKDKHYLDEDALPENGRILFVTAHADDLEFMAGGTLPHLLERGNKVYLVILTNGGKQRYMPGFYSRAIIKTRREDQLKIAKAEGLTEVFFENNKDGYLKYSEGIFDKVDEIAQALDITDIFTFETGKRSGYYDSDHDAAGRVGTAAAKANDRIKGLYYFRASDPNLIVDITKEFDKKLEIMFMFTEFRYKHRMMIAMHKAWAGADGSLIGVKYGEVFSYTELHKEPVFAEKRQRDGHV
jgi:LmbE family N-acetylglucosaminyl deacetylase